MQVYRSSAYPRVEVLAPNQVHFVVDFDPVDPAHLKALTKLVATLVYYHPGSSSRNAVLMSQTASVLIGNRMFLLVGQQLGRFNFKSQQDSWNTRWTWHEEGALPVLIKPQEAARTEVLFATRMTGNVTSLDHSINWEQFVPLTYKQKIRIRIDSEFAGHRHVFTDFDLDFPVAGWDAKFTSVQTLDVSGSVAKKTDLPGK